MLDYQANIQEMYVIPKQEEITIEWVRKIFTDVVENPEVDEALISQYFSSEYVQNVDGHILNYADFLAHMRAQKAAVKSVKIVIDRCVIQGNSFSTLHRAQVVKKDGSELEAKIIAHFEVKDKKLVYCEELTKLLSGSKEDEDLGSRK